jgi:hypothetical protein
MTDDKPLDQVSTTSSKSDDNDDCLVNNNTENACNNNHMNNETVQANTGESVWMDDPSSPNSSSFPMQLEELQQAKQQPSSNGRRRKQVFTVVTIVVGMIVAGAVLMVTLGPSSSKKDETTSVRGSATALDQTTNSSNTTTMAPTTIPVVVTSVPSTGVPSVMPTLLLRTGSPTVAPTNGTMGPTMEPSEPPPTVSPTGSRMPSTAPSISAAPTYPFKIIDPSTKFTMRMHWEPEYMWQDDPDEMYWCWECTECAINFDALEAGNGCNDGDRDDPSCEREDQLWIQRCNGEGSSKGNAEFQLVQQDTYDVFRVADSDLCLTRINKEPDYIHRYLYMDVCSALNLQQRWKKIPDLFGQPFDLRPDVIAFEDTLERCVMQLHHPKEGEVLHMGECVNAYDYNTALYDALPVEDDDEEDDEDDNEDEDNDDDN